MRVVAHPQRCHSDFGYVLNNPVYDPKKGAVVFMEERVYEDAEFEWLNDPSEVPIWCAVIDDTPPRAGTVSATTRSSGAVAHKGDSSDKGQALPSNVKHKGGPWYEITAGDGNTEKVMGRAQASERAAELKQGAIRAEV